MQRNKFVLVTALLAFILLATNASAGLPQWKLVQLCQEAECITTAKVENISQAVDCTFIIFRPVELFKGDLIGTEIKVRVSSPPAGDSLVFTNGNLALLFLTSCNSEGTYKLCDPLQGVYFFNSGRAVRPTPEETVPWATLTAETRRITGVGKATGVELSTWGKIKELFR
jgi:hypothetical protein